MILSRVENERVKRFEEKIATLIRLTFLRFFFYFARYTLIYNKQVIRKCCLTRLKYIDKNEGLLKNIIYHEFI